MQGQLVTACIDCTKYEPRDSLGHVLALLSGAPYLIIFAQALVGSVKAPTARLNSLQGEAPCTFKTCAR